MAKHKTSSLITRTTRHDVALILHAHVPFLRQPGRDSTGEEALHGLIAHTYAPLLAGLYDLVEAGVRVRLGLALSPILMEQLADPVVQKHTVQSLETALAQANERVQYHRSQHDDHAAYVAQFYAQLHRRTLNVFERQFGRNLVVATRTLAEAGVLEIIAQTATHSVPQCLDRTSLRVQLESGLICILRHLGQRPSMLWSADEPITSALVDLLPPLSLRGVVRVADPSLPITPPHWVNTARNVWAIAPNQQLLTHVHSVALGYPGDGLYRAAAAHAFSDETRTTQGTPYDPYHAYARTKLHAQHFNAVLEEMSQQQSTPLVLACPMALFGSGWFEGGLWLRTILETLHRSPTLKLYRPSDLIAHYPPNQVILPEPDNHQVDGELLAAAMRFQEVVNDYPRAYGDREDVLNQAARELLLAQSGDWDRWQNTPGASYALERRKQHLAQLAWLIELTEHEVLLPVAAREFAKLKERDNPFRALNYRLFGTHEDR